MTGLQCEPHAGFRFRHRRRRHRRGLRRLPPCAAGARGHPRARACRGLSHDRPLGGAAFGDLRQCRDPRHHRGIGPLLSKAAGGLHRPSPAHAARRADRRPRRATGRHAEGCRRLRPPGAERALARSGRGAAPPAVAEARSGRRRCDLRGGRGHGRGGDPWRLPQGRAGGGRGAAAQCRGQPSRPQGRTLDDPAARRRERHRQHPRQRLGRLGRRPGRPGGRRAGGAGAQAAHRLHLRRASRRST